MDQTEEISEEMIAKYTESLTEQERLVMEIAKEHLQSSFDVFNAILLESSIIHILCIKVSKRYSYWFSCYSERH